MTMVCGSWPPSSHHQQADRDECWCLTGCLSCILSETPDHRAVPPLIKETALLSQAFLEIPSQSHRGFDFMRILNPVNLTTKGNPRTTKPSNAELLTTSLRHACRHVPWEAFSLEEHSLRTLQLLLPKCYLYILSRLGLKITVLFKGLF